MTPVLLLGVDVGTTGLKAVLMMSSGEILGEAHQEYPTHYPYPGWAEQDPEEWWSALRTTVRRLMVRQPHPGQALAGICISSLAPVVLPLDACGRPLTRALIWADKRAEEESAWLSESIGEKRINAVTANHISPYYGAPKILWLKRNQPDVFARAHKIVTANGYVNFRLTGRHTIDRSHLPLYLMADIQTGSWSPMLCDAIGVPMEKLPDVCGCLDVIGTTGVEASEDLGIPANTPVIGGTVDTVAALVGMGIAQGGQAFVSMGTGSNVGTCVTEPAFDQPFVCIPHAIDGLWMLTGVMTSTGASLKWFRNELCGRERDHALDIGLDPYYLLMVLAEQSSVGSGGVIFLPYLMGEQAPFVDDDARAVFVGISASTNRGDLVRAIMEGCAFGIRQNFEVLGEGGWQIKEVRIQGGAAKSRLWNQIISDVTNSRVLVPPVSAGAPVGNAILVGLASGAYPDIETAMTVCAKPKDEVHPQSEAVALYDQLYPIYLELYERLRGSFQSLAAFRRATTSPEVPKWAAGLAV